MKANVCVSATTFASSARMYGVTGVGFPRRAFAALFFNSVRDGTTGLVLTSQSRLHHRNSQNDNFDILVNIKKSESYDFKI